MQAADRVFCIPIVCLSILLIESKQLGGATWFEAGIRNYEKQFLQKNPFFAKSITRKRYVAFVNVLTLIYFVISNRNKRQLGDFYFAVNKKP